MNSVWPPHDRLKILPMHNPFSKLVCGVAVGLSLHFAGNAYAGKLDGLLQKSPFDATPQPQSALKTEPDSGLELRSVLSEGDGVRFSLFDVGAKQSFWVHLNEPGKPVLAREYDRATETLSVEFNGRQLKVPLKKAKLVARNDHAVPEAAKGVAAVPLPATVAPARPAEEVQRMQRITDEVRNRRIARQTGVRPAGEAPRQ